MKPYFLPPDERIRDWREIRDSLISDQTDQEQLLLVLNYWQQFPTVSYFLNPDEPETWPSPWEIIYKGDLCNSSYAYMMEQTLLLGDSRWSPDRFQLLYIDDKEKSMATIILVVDDKYVLNYSQNEIINFDIIKKCCIIQHKYSRSLRHRHQLI